MTCGESRPLKGMVELRPVVRRLRTLSMIYTRTAAEYSFSCQLFDVEFDVHRRSLDQEGLHRSLIAVFRDQ